MSEDSGRPRVPWAGLAACLAVMVLAHFSRGPNDFVLDDWTNLKDFAAKPWPEILDKATRHPTRPVSLLWVMAGFRMFGDHPAAFFLLSLACQTACLALVFLLARRAGLPTRTQALAPLVFTLWPMLSENIRWPTMIAGAAACALPAYLAAMAGFLAWIRRGDRVSGLAGLAAYAFGVFCYESGILLPAACLAFADRAAWRRVAGVAAGCAGVLAVYAGFRLSNALGRGTFQLAAHFTPDLSPGALFWNLRQTLGLAAHSLRPPAGGFDWQAAAAAAIGAGVLFAACRAGRTTRPVAPAASEIARPFAFGLLWLAAGLVPALIGYTASRVLYLPMIGASLAAVALAGMAPRVRGAGAMLGVLALYALALNHAAQRDWIRSGEAQRSVRETLRSSNAAWRSAGMEAVIIDTSGLSGAPDRRAYQFGQAGFLRGFALENMAHPAPRPLPVYLDVECGVRREGDDWVWHERHRPDRPRRLSAGKVVLTGLSGAPGDRVSLWVSVPGDPLP